MIYLVSYDLDAKGPQNYEAISVALDECGVANRFQKSVCLLSSSMTPVDIREKISPLLGGADSLFVAEMNSHNWAGFRTRVQAWLKENSAEQ